MSFAENSINSLDFRKSEEFIYQVSEQRYHLQNVAQALKEAVYHLKKSNYHASLAKECNKNFKQ